MTGASRPPAPNGDPASARQLFRYLGGEEWAEYRAILRVFAGTFFADFSPEEVASEVAPAGVDPSVVPDRLESLYRWGNLTVSSSVGNPASLDDYYRKRNRYLITRAGQEVFEFVEQMLERTDEIGDVQAGRLRDLNRALIALGRHGDAGFDRVSGQELGDAVRAVFDLHERFTDELTRFFAELNQWQSRYDLDADEVCFFASVLVDYVSEQLTEIERMTRPIARSLEQVLPRLDTLLPALRSGLAARVDEAGLAADVAVRRLPGTEAADWRYLEVWFTASPGRPSRLDQHTRQAVAAVRTLTANVTRLSRVGLGAASRRSDFVRLAGFFDQAASRDDAHRIAAAALGLGSCRRLNALADDAEDPVPTITPWQDAPRAVVPVALRERGETGSRGPATPIANRESERDLLRRRREMDRFAREAAAAELLACADSDGRIDGAQMSAASFAMLRDLVSRSGMRTGIQADNRFAAEHGVRCSVQRVEGARTEIAAALYGSAHALDDGETLARAATHALRYRVNPPVNAGGSTSRNHSLRLRIGPLDDERGLWEAAGIRSSQVSAPALVWAVPAVGASPLAMQIRMACNAGLPLHLNLFALRRHPIAVDAGTPVLVVENPRLVEAAAERKLPVCVVSSNGNPSTAVSVLLGQLQQAEARLWYHGDFDAPGIAICRRMHQLGLTPWMMAAGEYTEAIRQAAQSDVPLMSESADCGPTPWDPELQGAFNRHRLIVHEEFVLDDVLTRFNRLNGS